MAAAFDLWYVVLRFRLALDDPRQDVWLTGPAVRGALGNRLRQLACLTGQPDCGGCVHQAWCPYFSLFESCLATEQAPHQARGVLGMPHAYVLRAPYTEGGDVIVGLTLIGRAVVNAPLVIQAMRAMGHGATRQRVRFRVRKVEVRGQAGMWRGIDDVSPRGEPVLVGLAGYAGELAGQHVARLRCEFVTGVELQDAGQLQGGVLPAVLVRRLVQRIETLGALYCGASLPPEQRAAWVADGDALELEDHDIWWEHDSAWSSRQRRDVPVHLLRGSVQLAGPLNALAPLFVVATDIGIGRKTSRGAGECAVTLGMATSELARTV